jgi:hypothetical protein
MKEELIKAINTIFECTKTMRENYPDQDNINRIEEVESYKEKIAASVEKINNVKPNAPTMEVLGK